jgi:hypothetical protein
MAKTKMKKNIKLEMTKIEEEQIEKKKVLEYLCPRRSFVKLVVEDFLAKTKKRGELVFGFDLGGGILPPQPPSLKGSILMCSCHLLEFLKSPQQACYESVFDV